jgi:pullulanase/glycogen debranching enzyme
VKRDEIIKDVDKNVKLTPQQMKLNKLAALFLFTSRGIAMIHSGQEFARSKVIPQNIPEQDPHKGIIDHNTYDKDNETNYINYNHASINFDLLNYYQGLIELRKTSETFRKADYSEVTFFTYKDKPFALGYSIKYKHEEFVVMFNADPKFTFEADLPKGEWTILADENQAGINPIKTVQQKVTLNSSSGMILKKSK